jgi:predicted amidophosphoribosyltransferase
MRPGIHRDPDGFVWPPRPPEGHAEVEPGSTEPRGVAIAEDKTAGGAEGAPLEAGIWQRFESALLGGVPGWRLPPGWEADAIEETCPRCGGGVGVGEVDPNGCASCRPRRLAWDRSIRLGVYDGALRDGIQACKYHRDRRAGRLLGEALGRRVWSILTGDGVTPAELIVVPVPTTTRRRLGNGGLDHALILAEEVGRVLGVRPERLLERRHRAHQAGLSASARARNLAGTIRVRSARRLGRAGHVVLVDDVRTTGATASACFKAIREGFGLAVDGSGIPPDCPRFWLATVAVSSYR